MFGDYAYGGSTVLSLVKLDAPPVANRMEMRKSEFGTICVGYLFSSRLVLRTVVVVVVVVVGGSYSTTVRTGRPLLYTFTRLLHPPHPSPVPVLIPVPTSPFLPPYLW